VHEHAHFGGGVVEHLDHEFHVIVNFRHCSEVVNGHRELIHAFEDILDVVDVISVEHDLNVSVVVLCGDMQVVLPAFFDLLGWLGKRLVAQSLVELNEELGQVLLSVFLLVRD